MDSTIFLIILKKVLHFTCKSCMLSATKFKKNTILDDNDVIEREMRLMTFLLPVLLHCRITVGRREYVAQGL